MIVTDGKVAYESRARHATQRNPYSSCRRSRWPQKEKIQLDAIDKNIDVENGKHIDP